MAFVPGKHDLASGTGIYTIGIPSNDAIAIDDPGVEGQFPVVALALNLQSAAPVSLSFVGDASSIAPNPADSIGFTAPTLMAITNNTGKPINGLLLTLANDDPQLPLSLVPGVIEFGHTVNANYAFFSQTEPVAGMTTSLFSPDGKPTTATGAAASSIALTGPIAAGATVNVATVIHDTELSTGNNNFHMFISPT